MKFVCIFFMTICFLVASQGALPIEGDGKQSQAMTRSDDIESKIDDLIELGNEVTEKQLNEFITWLKKQDQETSGPQQAKGYVLSSLVDDMSSFKNTFFNPNHMGVKLYVMLLEKVTTSPDFKGLMYFLEKTEMDDALEEFINDSVVRIVQRHISPINRFTVLEADWINFGLDSFQRSVKSRGLGTYSSVQRPLPPYASVASAGLIYMALLNSYKAIDIPQQFFPQIVQNVTQTRLTLSQLVEKNDGKLTEYEKKQIDLFQKTVNNIDTFLEKKTKSGKIFSTFLSQ